MSAARILSCASTRLPAWLGLGLTLLAASAPVPTGRAAGGNPTRPKVAMMDFTSDDGLMRSVAGAAQWSALVQGVVAEQEPGIDWVERTQLHLAADELNLSAGGFTSTSGSLRLGKWLQADLAILGRFTRNGQDSDGHTLRLEVVDLSRGDNLAVRTIQLDGDRRAAIIPEVPLVQPVTDTLRGALAEARAKLARTARQKVVAPLFFQNADASPRLDRFGSDLLDVFTEEAAATDDVRVLRFPQATEARGEEELAVRGLSESDPDAWRQVADLYVWGSYHELPAGEAAFAQTPVGIELILWDGIQPPRHVQERAVVAELPTLARRLASRCLDVARQVPQVRPAAATARSEIARALREQGQRLEAASAGHGTQQAAFLATPEGETLLRQQRLLLEVACFFDPADREAQLARLRATWTDFPSPFRRLPLLDLWHRSNDLAEYAERFGRADPGMARLNVDADAYLLNRLHDGEDQLHQPRGEPNLPVDATAANLAEWHAALDARFARDVIAYVQTAAELPGGRDETHPSTYATWMQAALQLTRDPAVAARIAETVWPRYKAYYQQNAPQEDHRYGFRDGGLSTAVQELYARLHQPERAAAMLAALSTGGVVVSGPSVPPATAAAPTAPAVLLPPLKPAFRTVRFPEAAAPAGSAEAWEHRDSPYLVHNLVLGGGLLWISAFHAGDGSRQFNRDPTQELWRFDPVDDALEKLPIEGLTQKTPITSILPQSGSLWLTIGLTGVWQCDPARAQVTRRHTVADGLLTPDIDAGLAGPDGRLYFAGHENGRPLLNRFDPAGPGWQRVELPASAVDASSGTAEDHQGFPWTPPAAQIVAFQRWLLIRLGESWTLLDTSSDRAQHLREALPVPLAKNIASWAETVQYPRTTSDHLPLPRPRPCTADVRGFWLAVDGKILRFDPAKPEEARSWALPEDLAGGVTAIAADGEELWLAGPAGRRRSAPPSGIPPSGLPRLGHHERGAVAVLHEADGQWRGSFELPAPVGCLAASRQVVYADQQAEAQPLVEIDKEATLATAPR